MEHNGYAGSVHYSDEDEVFHGRLEGIADLVTYQGTWLRHQSPRGTRYFRWLDSLIEVLQSQQFSPKAIPSNPPMLL
jgi:predicted HicB family RNase H-like nuclease